MGECVYMYMCVCVCVYIHICVCACMYAHVCVRMYVCACMCVHVCVCGENLYDGVREIPRDIDREAKRS